MYNISSHRVSRKASREDKKDTVKENDRER